MVKHLDQVMCLSVHPEYVPFLRPLPSEAPHIRRMEKRRGWISFPRPGRVEESKRGGEGRRRSFDSCGVFFFVFFLRASRRFGAAGGLRRDGQKNERFRKQGTCPNQTQAPPLKEPPFQSPKMTAAGLARMKGDFKMRRGFFGGGYWVC